jgi:hypothetical protein
MNVRKLLALIGSLAMGATLASSNAFADTQPALSSINITATSVSVTEPPDALPFVVTFTAPLGLQKIIIWGLSETLNAASEAQDVPLYFDATNLNITSGKISIATPFAFNDYVIDGHWKITAAEICDIATNCHYYDRDSLTDILQNPNFTVKNATGLSDNTPAKVSAGKIVTPKVSLAKSLQFKYSLTAAQAVQGIQHLSIYYNPPDSGVQIYEETDLPAPAKSGVFTGGISLGSDAPLGTYTIVGVGACPVVFQSPCTGAYTPAAIRKLLGAATFTVTK